MRSTVGGVGMPTGEGVTNSPSSPLISAMTPANGARSCVRCEMRTRDVDARVRDAGRVFGRGAAGGRRLGSAFGLIGRFLRREPLGAEHASSRSASRLATSADDAGLARARARRACVALRERQLGFDVVVPQLEQQVARFDAVAVLDGQRRDLAAERRRQARRAGTRRRCRRACWRRWRRPGRARR